MSNLEAISYRAKVRNGIMELKNGKMIFHWHRHKFKRGKCECGVENEKA